MTVTTETDVKCRCCKKANVKKLEAFEMWICHHLLNISETEQKNQWRNTEHDTRGWMFVGNYLRKTYELVESCDRRITDINSNKSRIVHQNEQVLWCQTGWTVVAVIIYKLKTNRQTEKSIEDLDLATRLSKKTMESYLGSINTLTLK